MYPNPSDNKENISDKSRLNQFISDQYYGDLHTKNVPITGERFPHIYDGYGDQSSLQLGLSSIKIDDDEINMKLLVDLFYPINSVVVSMSDVLDIPYSTWQKVSQGRFIASVGSGTDSLEQPRDVVEGVSGGLYDVQLTEAQLASHTHSTAVSNGAYKYFTFWNKTSELGARFAGSENNDTYAFPNKSWQIASELESVGGDQYHNNIPPSYGVNIFKRIN